MILFLSFFMIGLTGGFGHCVLMCHPFVLYVSSRYVGAGKGSAFFLPHIYYNIGRVITYWLLGAVAGLFGAVIQFTTDTFVNVQRSAAIVAGVLLVIYAVLTLFNITIKKFGGFDKVLKRFAPDNPLLTGVVLGFLPCGLSMGAVIGSMSSGSPIISALQMISFGLGTMVALMVVALFGNLALRYVKYFSKIAVVLLLFMGAYFIYMGLSYSL